MPDTTQVNSRLLAAKLEFRSEPDWTFSDFGFRLSDLFSVIGPKRSEFRQNSGRAPIVKMSRIIPPTPVAAPWNGSIALGWLWLSILNAIAQPSPISTTPAFSSPALTRILA